MTIKAPAGDADAASAYERFLVPYIFQPWALRAMKWATPAAGEDVLDVACGTGAGTRLIAATVGLSGHVVGVDSDGGMLAVAQDCLHRLGVRASWHQASAAQMPLDSASFDLCLCLQGLQFFPDQRQALSEVRRVLRPGGRLLVTTWGPIESNPGHEAFYRAMNKQGIDTTSPRRGFSLSDPNQLRVLVQRAGFRAVAVHEEDTVARVPSIAHFVHGMAFGAPYTRRVLGELTATARSSCIGDAIEDLKPLELAGQMALPMRVNILHALR